jgi:tetratricopeptide (TPR) repeat protein
LSTATDVYALGVMLYRLLTGLSPYQPPRDTRGALEEAVLLATPAIASSRTFESEALQARQTTTAALRKTLRDNLDVILAKALKKNPQERYATVAMLADDLRRHLAQQPISARADSGWYRTRLFVARNRVAVLASSLAAVALMGTAGTAVWQARVSARNAALATKEAASANAVQKLLAGMLAKADPESNKHITALDRQLIDQTLAGAEKEFAAAPETLLQVLKQLGDIYQRLGIPAKHLEVQKKRVAWLGQSPEAGADDRVDAHVSLSYALRESELAEERASALPKAIAAQEMAVSLRASDSLRVWSLCVIADLYLAQSKFKEADEFASRAVALAESALPQTHSERAMAYDQRGATATRLGNFDIARESFKKAMSVGAIGPGRSKLSRFNSQTALANSEHLAGNFGAAKREALAALEFAQTELGGTEGTLTPVRVRAILASERAGDVDEAAHLVQTILVSDLTSTDRFRSARAHYVKGVVAMSRAAFRQAAEAFSAAQSGLGVDPRWARQLVVQQATLTLKLGQARVAHHKLSELIDQIRAGPGTSNEDFSTAAERLGVARARINQPGEATAIFEEACAWRRSTLKETHPVRVRCESYVFLSSDAITVEEKRLALQRQLFLLTRNGNARLALASSLRSALKWLGNPPKRRPPLRTFPLLD